LFPVTNSLKWVFDLHAIDFGRPVPISSGHGLDDRKAGILDAALDTAVMTQGDFTGDKFLKITGDGRSRGQRRVRRLTRHFRVDNSDGGCGDCPAE
jgi:hypothetical protein